MLALKFAHLIAQHSDELTEGLVRRLHTAPRSRSLQKVPASELRSWLHDTLCQFHAWLLSNGDSDVEERFLRVGRHHAIQEVALQDLCWATIVTKEYLWEFVGRHSFHKSAVDILGELEFVRLLDLFFDRTLYYITAAYEEVQGQSLSRLRAGVK